MPIVFQRDSDGYTQVAVERIGPGTALSLLVIPCAVVSIIQLARRRIAYYLPVVFAITSVLVGGVIVAASVRSGLGR